MRHRVFAIVSLLPSLNKPARLEAQYFKNPRQLRNTSRNTSRNTPGADLGLWGPEGDFGAPQPQGVCVARRLHIVIYLASPYKMHTKIITYRAVVRGFFKPSYTPIYPPIYPIF